MSLPDDQSSVLWSVGCLGLFGLWSMASTVAAAAAADLQVQRLVSCWLTELAGLVVCNAPWVSNFCRAMQFTRSPLARQLYECILLS